MYNDSYPYIKISYDKETNEFIVTSHSGEGQDWHDTDSNIDEIVSTVEFQLEKLRKKFK